MGGNGESISVLQAHINKLYILYLYNAEGIQKINKG